MTHYLLIVNPVSGDKKGLEILDYAIAVFKDRGIRITSWISQYPGHITKFIKDCQLEPFNAICVIGGDGTMHETINGMMSRADGFTLPIGLIPAGTGNSLLRDLQIYNPSQALQVINSNATKTIDLFEIKFGKEKVYGFNVLAWGVPADINRQAEKMRWLRSARYNLAAVFHLLKNKKRKVTISFDHSHLEGSYGFLVACNTIHTGKGMRMAPQADISDGLIDLLIVHDLSRVELFSLFGKVFSGTHHPNPGVEYYQVKSLSIDCPKKEFLTIDGQVCGYTPCQVKVLPSSISVFAPPD